MEQLYHPVLMNFQLWIWMNQNANLVSSFEICQRFESCEYYESLATSVFDNCVMLSRFVVSSCNKRYHKRYRRSSQTAIYMAILSIVIILRCGYFSIVRWAAQMVHENLECRRWSRRPQWTIIHTNYVRHSQITHVFRVWISGELL